MDAQAWNERYTSTPLQWGTDPNQWVVRELGAVMPSTALDLAAGEGRHAIWLAAEGWQVTAVDFSAVAVERGRELAQDKAAQLGRSLDIDWRVGDATSVELPQAAFGAVLMCYLQLPGNERREAIRRGARCLAPGGVLLVIAHDPTNLTDGFGGPQDPEVLYSAADVEDDLQDYLSSGSMTVERGDRVAREVATDDGPRIAWDMLVRIKRRDPHKSEVAFG